MERQPPLLGGAQPAGPQHQVKPAASLATDPRGVGPREEPSPCLRGRRPWKTPGNLERASKNLLGVKGVERPEGCPGNWRGPPRPRVCDPGSSACPITGGAGKWRVVERQSEGVVVVLDRRDNTTRRERRAPASSMRVACEEEARVSAELASSARREEGVAGSDGRPLDKSVPRSGRFTAVPNKILNVGSTPCIATSFAGMSAAGVVLAVWDEPGRSPAWTGLTRGRCRAAAGVE